MRKLIVRFILWCLQPHSKELQANLRAAILRELNPHLIETQRHHDMLARAIFALEQDAYDGSPTPPHASYLYRNKHILRH